MKKLRYWSLLVILVLFYLFPAWAGRLTDNGFIYRPDLGSRGSGEKDAFESGLNRIDTRLGKEIWVGDPNYGTTLQAALSAINSAPVILRVPSGTMAITADTSIPANVTLKMERGAVFGISTGQTLTINGGLEAGLYQIFSCSGTGKVQMGNLIPEVYPEWWGAVPNGVTDSGAAIQAACTTLNANSTGYKNVKFNPGTYIINTGQILFNQSNYMQGQKIRGAGAGQAYKTRQGHDASASDDWSGGTILQFNDSTINACVKVDTINAYVGGWEFGHLAIVGPGKAVGTNIHGVWLTNTSATYPGVNSLQASLFEDLALTNLSGTGFYALKLWDSAFKRCYAGRCAGHGFLIEGNDFDGGGRFTYDIDGVALWMIKDSTASPVIKSFNCGDVGTGMKFGIDLADKAAESLPDWLLSTQIVRKCGPTIMAANIEPCKTAGIVFRGYSNFIYAGQINIYAAASTVIARGIEWNSPINSGLLMRLPNFYVLGSGGTLGSFTYYYYNDRNINFNTGANVFMLVNGTEWRTKVVPYLGGNQTGIFTPFGGSVAGLTASTIPTYSFSGGASGEMVSQTSSSYTLPMVAGATTTFNSAIPAGAIVKGVTTRITEAIVGPTSIDIGDGSTVDLFANNTGVTLNTTTTPADGTATAPKIYPAGANIVLTANGGNFIGGAGKGIIEITVFYEKLTAQSQ